MLDQGRYTWRHDSTLNKIKEFINQVNDSNIIINVDLGEKPWTIPPALLVTSDRPDHVVIDNTKKCISILELTVLFKNNVNRNHEYKCHKYIHLCIYLQRISFNIKYFAIKIGCRAIILDSNSKCMHFTNSSEVSSLIIEILDILKLPSIKLCKLHYLWFLIQSTVNPGSHLCLIVMCKMILTW